ncbi:hypothetical protein [Corynebacterium sp. CCM 9203]|uniref:hypothetical protein n=1 Tax=Corynebacterium sp. CCM 9203 TaxID=3057615 RepID=UPI003523D620
MRRIAAVAAFIVLLLSAAPIATAQTAEEGTPVTDCVIHDITTTAKAAANLTPLGTQIGTLLTMTEPFFADKDSECEFGDGIKGAVSSTAGKIATGAFGKFTESMVRGTRTLWITVMTFWINVPSADLVSIDAGEIAKQAARGAESAISGGSDPQSGAVEGVTDALKTGKSEGISTSGDLSQLRNPFSGSSDALRESPALSWVRDKTLPLQVIFLVIGLLLASLRIAVAYFMAQGKEAFSVASTLTKAVLYGALFSTMVTLGTQASDGVASWIIDEAVSAPVIINQLKAVELGAASAAVPLGLWLIISLLSILAGLMQLAFVLIRSVSLIAIAAALPLAASASLSKTGAQSMDRLVGWAIAFVLFKPAAAIIYALAFRMMDLSVGGWDTIYALILLSLSVFVLPSLMKLVAPNVSSIGTGPSALGIAAGTAGIAATGAMIAATGGAGAASAGGRVIPSGTTGSGPAPMPIPVGLPATAASGPSGAVGGASGMGGAPVAGPHGPSGAGGSGSPTLSPAPAGMPGGSASRPSGLTPHPGITGPSPAGMPGGSASRPSGLTPHPGITGPSPAGTSGTSGGTSAQGASQFLRGTSDGIRKIERHLDPEPPTGTQQ